MSRCYPFPPPGYEKKAPHLSVDVAQPHKDKRDRHKHKDKKKKKKKDGDSNGDTTHDKDSSRPSKQPRTVLINDLLQSKDEKQSTGLTVRLAIPPGVAVPRSPLVVPSTSGEPSLVENARKTPVTPPQQQQQQQQQPPPLYSKQEPNGKAAADVQPAGVTPKVVLVLAPESSSGKEQQQPQQQQRQQRQQQQRQQQPSSSRPGSNSTSHNLDGSQRQSPELPASPGCEMLVLKQPKACSEVADEEWLFAGRRPLGSHPKPKAEVARGAAASESSSVQVWAEAVFLPSCEIYALPYVVPY